MTLKEWLKSNKISHENFALMLGVSRASITRYCDSNYGKIPHNRKKQIALVTKGEVKI